MKRLPHQLYLPLILFAALTLRLIAALALDPPLISDSADYVAIGRSIVAGTGYSLDGAPTAYRPPGYPVFLAAVYAMGGSSVTVRILQALCDTLSCFLVFEIGRVLAGQKSGLIGAAIYALFPLQILYTALLMTESVFTLLLLVIVRWLIVEPMRPGRVLIWGTLIGCAVLVRPTGLFLPLLLLTVPAATRLPLRNRLTLLGFAFLGMLIVLSPWMIRNAIVFDRLGITSNTGVNFWIGNHDGANGTYSYPDDNPLRKIDDEFVRSDEGIRLGLEFWKAAPLNASFILGLKFAHFFERDYWIVIIHNYRPEWRLYKRVIYIYRELSPLSLGLTHLPFAAALFLATFAFVALPPEKRTGWQAVIVLCIAWLCTHLVFFTSARYRFPLHPFLIIGAVEGYHMIRARSYVLSRPRSAIFGVLILMYLAGWTTEILMLASVSSMTPP